MAFNQQIYSGLQLNTPVDYNGPNGEERHFYYGAGSPVSGAPETGSIITFPNAPHDKVNVIDKFNASVTAADTSLNVIQVSYLSPDYSKIYFQFQLQMGLLIGNPNYTYPTFLSDQKWMINLSFVANNGSFPMEYFSFRYRYLDKNGVR